MKGCRKDVGWINVHEVYGKILSVRGFFFFFFFFFLNYNHYYCFFVLFLFIMFLFLFVFFVIICLLLNYMFRCTFRLKSDLFLRYTIIKIFF